MKKFMKLEIFQNAGWILLEEWKVSVVGSAWDADSWWCAVDLERALGTVTHSGRRWISNDQVERRVLRGVDGVDGTEHQA
jgi:hypothetical protein